MRRFKRSGSGRQLPFQQASYPKQSCSQKDEGRWLGNRRGLQRNGLRGDSVLLPIGGHIESLDGSLPGTGKQIRGRSDSHEVVKGIDVPRTCHGEARAAALRTEEPRSTAAAAICIQPAGDDRSECRGGGNKGDDRVGRGDLNGNSI